MQPTIDFYLLAQPEKQDKFLYACRVIEKAYLRNHVIFIYCENQADAESLDEMLWTFKEESFIPHNLQGEGPEPPPPVQIGYGDEPRNYQDILINLSSEVPSFFKRFKRIIEVVTEDNADKDQSRSRYRQYRNNQCSIKTHSIKA